MIEFGERHFTFRFADLTAQLILQVEDRLNRLMTGKQSLEDLVLRNDLRPPFDHDNGILAAGQEDIHVAFIELTLRWIDHPLAMVAADANAGQWTVERDIRDMQSRRGADHGDDVRIIFSVRRQHGCDHLGLATQPLGEQRAN